MTPASIPGGLAQFRDVEKNLVVYLNGQRVLPDLLAENKFHKCSESDGYDFITPECYDPKLWLRDAERGKGEKCQRC